MQAELVSVANGCCVRYKMKAIVPLFTATLFVVCSAFPLYEKSARGQQSNSFCATLAYPQSNPAAYVHLCYTPGEGISLYKRACVFNTTRQTRLTSRVCMQSYIPPSSPLLLQVLASRQTFLDVYPPVCRTQLQWMWHLAMGSTRFCFLQHHVNPVSN